MELTNVNNYPEALVSALKNDTYNKGDSDYSITELLTPPRIKRLKDLHRDEIREDVEDGLYRLYGQLAHALIERANINDLAEKRYFAEFSDKKISGQIDTLSLKDGTLSDFKFSTVWKFKINSPIDENWIAQLNMQLELLRQNGLDATKLQIIGLIRDYRMREAKQYPDSYPKTPIVTVPIPIWTREKTQSFIKMRIAAHESAKTELPECTTDERWAKPDSWAVVKGTRAIAGGIQYSKLAAEKIAEYAQGTKVEFRKGESVRCIDYCNVSKFCAQYQASVGNGS